MKAPDLYLWQPITLDLKAAAPLSSTGLVVPFDMQIGFPNPGPLNLDLGVIKLNLKNAGETFLVAGTDKSMVLKNVHNGGMLPGNPENGLFKVTFPWHDLNPLFFFKHLLTFLNGHDWSVEFEATQPDSGPVTWLNTVVADILTKEELAAVGKVATAIIARLKLEVFGFPIPISKIPGGKQFLSAANNVLESLPSQYQINPMPGSLEPDLSSTLIEAMN